MDLGRPAVQWLGRTDLGQPVVQLLGRTDDTHEATQAPIPSPLRQSIIVQVRPDKLDDFMKVVELHIL